MVRQKDKLVRKHVRERFAKKTQDVLLKKHGRNGSEAMDCEELEKGVRLVCRTRPDLSRRK
ncbi:MAG: hypothetical protein BSOLF_0977 [Candidatus Carbobacillus altaicus]|uniref:Uncharacterized protein n=1 Tax=Candidatus Carbonibacillus altaicus TaxID=2163959 RepID=A0A2R6Y042_9BACL|nr:MAG: hypothetical protein BSOLF_0977 [Candidatus Carbobacillus altaicus]